MKMIPLLCLAVAFVSSAPSGPLHGALQQPLTLEFKELPEDTKLATSSGATFTVSKGWLVARSDNIIVIQEPQRELAAAFVEVSAPTVEEAIAQAWKRWKPDFARTVRQTAKPPASGGWDEIAPPLDRQGNLRKGGSRDVLALASELRDQLFQSRIVAD